MENDKYILNNVQTVISKHLNLLNQVLRMLTKMINYNFYLYYTNLLSIQQHTLCHTNQSRDYRLHRLYIAPHTAWYSSYRTTLCCTLLYRNMQNHFFSNIIVHTLFYRKMQGHLCPSIV